MMSMAPMMPVSMLLKSWATPPVSCFGKLIAHLKLPLTRPKRHRDGAEKRLGAERSLKQDDVCGVVGRTATDRFAGPYASRRPAGEQNEGDVRPCGLRHERAPQWSKVASERLRGHEHDSGMIIYAGGEIVEGQTDRRVATVICQ
jgi:hypothetical protein